MPRHYSPRPRVAIIDVESRARDALRDLLATLDVEVVTYPAAESYLDADGQAQCLIVSMTLPGLSGLDLLERLRSAGSRVPVILLADESDVPTAVTAMRAGASDFLEKPHADIAVLRRVAQLLRQRPH